MDSKNPTQQLTELLQNNIKNAEAMASILLSPDYEADLTKNLTPEQKEEFIKAKSGSDFEKAKKDLVDKMAELQGLKNSMNK